MVCYLKSIVLWGVVGSKISFQCSKHCEAADIRTIKKTILKKSFCLCSAVISKVRMQKYPLLTSSIPKNNNINIVWGIHDCPAMYFWVHYYYCHPNKANPKNAFIAGYLTLRIRNGSLKQHFNGMSTIHAAKPSFIIQPFIIKRRL